MSLVTQVARGRDTNALHGYWIKMTQNQNVLKFICLTRYLKSFQSSLINQLLMRNKNYIVSGIILQLFQYFWSLTAPYFEISQ